MSIFSSIFGIVREYIPLECPVCGGPPFDGTSGMLCAECLAQLDFVPLPQCRGCGGELTGIMDMCNECLASEVARPWSNAYSVYTMDGFGRDLILNFKYRNVPELSRTLGMIVAMRLGETLRREAFDLIVPTPLHWFRYFQRGYNQSELLAAQIGASVDIPMKNLLRRVKWTRQQAKLSRKQRIANLKGAFAVRKSSDVAGRSVLLVDDVFTTGSTLAAAAETLLKTGASRVGVLVLARR